MATLPSARPQAAVMSMSAVGRSPVTRVQLAASSTPGQAACSAHGEASGGPGNLARQTSAPFVASTLTSHVHVDRDGAALALVYTLGSRLNLPSCHVKGFPRGACIIGGRESSGEHPQPRRVAGGTGRA